MGNSPKKVYEKEEKGSSFGRYFFVKTGRGVGSGRDGGRSVSTAANSPPVPKGPLLLLDSPIRSSSSASLQME